MLTARVFACSRHDDLVVEPYHGGCIWGFDTRKLSCDGASDNCQCKLLCIARLLNKDEEWHVLDVPIDHDLLENYLYASTKQWVPLRDEASIPARKAWQGYECKLHWVQGALEELLTTAKECISCQHLVMRHDPFMTNEAHPICFQCWKDIACYESY